MDGEKKVTLRCNEANAPEFRALVKAWPELGDLVAQLQAQNLFPGLRSMQVTLTGAAATQPGGVGALAQRIAQEAAQETCHAR